MTLRVVSLLVRLDTLYLADGARGIANLPAKYDELIRCEACKQCLMNCRVKKSLEEASSKITERMEEGLFDTNCKATPPGTFFCRTSMRGGQRREDLGSCNQVKR